MTASIQVETIGKNIAENYTDYAVQFMNERAPKLARASYSSGSYGRLMLPLLKKVYPYMNWNGMSTPSGLAVQRNLEQLGYKFHYESGNQVSFKKVAA